IDVNVTDPNFTSVTDLDVLVNMLEPHMGQVRIVLQSPGGSQVTLLNNRKDSQNNDISTNIGLPDVANLGILPAAANTGQPIRVVGTTFDQQVPRPINDTGAVAPFIGHYRPETGGLDGGFSGTGGLNVFNGFHLNQ